MFVGLLSLHVFSATLRQESRGFVPIWYCRVLFNQCLTTDAWCQLLPTLRTNDGQKKFLPPFLHRASSRFSDNRTGEEGGHDREASPFESWPLWSSSSPITLHVCSFADGPGTDQRGCPPRPSPIRPLAGQGVFAHPEGFFRGGFLRGCQCHSCQKE